jgi:glycosyltransferase involved in cell wall biosynthesis
MKIIFLAPFGIRPKGTLLARMLPLGAALQELGHNVTIVAPPYTNPEDSGSTETVCGVRVVNVQLGPGGKVLSALPIAWRMLRYALAEKPDVIHLFKPKGYGGIAAMLTICARRFGVRQPPMFLDTDDLEGGGGMNELHPYSGLEKLFYEFQEQWLTRRSHGVTVASRFLYNFSAGLGLNADRLLYLPNCVEQRPLGNGSSARNKLGIEENAPLLLLYTRFFEFRQDRLHRLFAAVHAALPQTRFLVVGRGPSREDEQLLQAAEQLGFRSALVMTGWVEPELLPELFACADLAVYPFEDTPVNRAKCPAKLTELLRSGIPVVADKVGQIPEYLSPQLQLFLCEPDETELMTQHCVHHGALQMAGLRIKTAAFLQNPRLKQD